jgi:hypothetical protein
MRHYNGNPLFGKAKKMPPSYQHTQKGGWAMYVTFGGALLLAAVLYFMLRDAPLNDKHDKIAYYIMLGGVIFTFALMLWATVFMSALTISIKDGFIKLRFGAGAWYKKFALDDIVSAKMVKSTFWHGWGIHYTGKAWLYNVAGYDAVEIKMKNAKKNCIGTDQPQKLTNAINNALGELS